MSTDKLLGQDVLITGRGMTYTGRLVGYSSLSYVLHVGSQNLTLRRDDTILTPPHVRGPSSAYHCQGGKQVSKRIEVKFVVDVDTTDLKTIEESIAAEMSRCASVLTKQTVKQVFNVSAHNHALAAWAYSNRRGQMPQVEDFCRGAA